MIASINPITVLIRRGRKMRYVLRPKTVEQDKVSVLAELKWDGSTCVEQCKAARKKTINLVNDGSVH